MARGGLRIHLGAAPGVGKTYAMLEEGQRPRAAGADVVAGFVEPHGRRPTAMMAEGLETVPRRTMIHRGAAFTEMDLDAVLARHPQVAPVDEPAHTDVPGSRNAKRRQDVEDLLEAGSDVVTTLNVQHLESLGDAVRQITGVPQRETLPDEVARRADQIELVDLPPELLRRRMLHGDISIPRTASRPPSPTASASATSRPCGNSPCCGSPTAWRKDCGATAPSTASPRPGRPASASRSP